MPIQRLHTAAMINDDGIAIAADPAGINDSPAVCCMDRRTIVDTDIHPRVIDGTPENRMGTISVGRRDDTAAWPGKLSRALHIVIITAAAFFLLRLPCGFSLTDALLNEVFDRIGTGNEILLHLCCCRFIGFRIIEDSLLLGFLLRDLCLYLLRFFCQCIEPCPILLQFGFLGFDFCLLILDLQNQAVVRLDDAFQKFQSVRKITEAFRPHDDFQIIQLTKFIDRTHTKVQHLLALLQIGLRFADLFLRLADLRIHFRLLVLNALQTGIRRIKVCLNGFQLDSDIFDDLLPALLRRTRFIDLPLNILQLILQIVCDRGNHRPCQQQRGDCCRKYLLMCFHDYTFIYLRSEMALPMTPITMPAAKIMRVVYPINGQSGIIGMKTRPAAAISETTVL